MSRALEMPIRAAMRSNRIPQCLSQQRTAYLSLDSHQPPAWLSQHRAFSSTPRRRANSQLQQPGVKRQAAPSMALAQKKQMQDMMRSGGLPDDVGLLPDTVVLPRGADRWNWTLRKRWLKTRFVEILAALTYKLYLVKPRPKLHLSEITGVARDLHERMFKAFAAGTLDDVSGVLCSGIDGNLRGRIARRKPGEVLDFKLTQRRRPKLVSYKAAVLPGPKEETSEQRQGVIQAVVELRTRQSIQQMNRIQKRVGGKLVSHVEPKPGSEVKEEDKTEYLVIQKSIRQSKAGPWKVWGFATPTTAVKLLNTGKS